MRGISLLKRRYTPFGRPPNWVSRAKTVHRTVFTPVLIFGGQKSFRRLRTTTLGFTPRPHDLFEKRSIKNFIRRLRSEIFIQQFNDIAGFRKHFEIPLAEQGAEDNECDAAMNVVFFAAPLPQVVKLA